MAYDRAFADRIRALVADEPGLAEKQMLAGLAFLVGGNMAVAASGQGGLLVRVDPAETDDLLGSPGVRLLEMRGRPMRGWLRVNGDRLETEEILADWVARGVSFARSLPAKG